MNAKQRRRFETKAGRKRRENDKPGEMNQRVFKAAVAHAVNRLRQGQLLVFREWFSRAPEARKLKLKTYCRGYDLYRHAIWAVNLPVRPPERFLVSS